MQIKRFLGNLAKAYLAIGALSVSAIATADMYPYQPNCDWGCAPQCDQAPACNWGYNPPAYNTCGACCGSNGFMDSLSGRVDFLWWRATEDGITLGYEDVINYSNATVDIPNPHGSGTEAFPVTIRNFTHQKDPNFKFDPGFRLGLRHYCPCDCWDIALNWTHFHTKANARGFGDFPADLDGESFPTDFEGEEVVLFTNAWERLQNQYPTFAHSKWNLNLDLLDLELGYKYYVSSCFALRPHFGLRGARIDQTVRVFSFADDENSFSDVLVTDFNDFDSKVKARNNFLALGPRLGVEATVHFGCGFSLFGEAAGSIVFGRFNRHAEEEYDYFGVEDHVTGGVETEYLWHSHNSNRNSRAITDLNVGLKWEHCFCWCNRMHPVSLAFSWEHHAFFNQNNFNFKQFGFGYSNGSAQELLSKNGDLFTQGLTVSLEVGF